MFGVGQMGIPTGRDNQQSVYPEKVVCRSDKKV
jgi:hypothetical protein